MTKDMKSTVFLPKTEFPMRAGLPKKEPEILAAWQEMDFFARLRTTARERRNSSSMTVRPMPMVTCISVMR